MKVTHSETSKNSDSNTYSDKCHEARIKVAKLNEFFNGENNFIKSMTHLSSYSYGQIDAINNIYAKFLEGEKNERDKSL